VEEGMRASPARGCTRDLRRPVSCARDGAGPYHARGVRRVCAGGTATRAAATRESVPIRTPPGG